MAGRTTSKPRKSSKAAAPAQESGATSAKELTMTTEEPTLVPPAEAGITMGDQASPGLAPPLEAATAATAEGRPITDPPTAESYAVGASGVWHNNKKIDGTWAINQNRNSWVHVSGLGWKQLAHDSDSAVVALTVLGAHARQLNRNTNVREENNQVVEMYVW